MTLARLKAIRSHGCPLILLALLTFPSLTSPTPVEVTESHLKNDQSLFDTMIFLTRVLLGGCLREVDASGLVGLATRVGDCLKRRSLIALDRAFTMDHLRIYEGVELVKNGNWTGNEDREVMKRNMKISWSEAVATKLDALFKSHLLKLHVKPENFIGEARRRHHYKDLLPIIIFGILAVSMIAIPLGFQFLAVLGGKALLLAKLALILTSIQGLKKIATSNLNYGLYQVPHQTYPCKDNLLYCFLMGDNSFDVTYGNDDVFLYVNFEDNAFGGQGYDRRLQQEMAGDPNKYPGYQQPDAVLDLLHPLSPRSTSGYDSME